MSFILDALRKSEHERQRAAMPGVAQVPFGLPRRELPGWATALIVVLLVALVALGGAWWQARRSETADVREAAVRREVPLALPAPASAVARATADPAPSSSPREAPPTPQSSTSGMRQAPPRDFNAASTGGAAGLPDRTPAGGARSSSPPANSEPTLPSATALAAEGVPVPPLRLELHAFAERPADRFVFINGTKYVEGARLAEGPQLVSIEPNGAVLSYLGRRFLLSTQ